MSIQAPGPLGRNVLADRQHWLWMLVPYAPAVSWEREERAVAATDSSYLNPPRVRSQSAPRNENAARYAFQAHLQKAAAQARVRSKQRARQPASRVLLANLPAS
jgi:hypothetical protein